MSGQQTPTARPPVAASGAKGTLNKSPLAMIIPQWNSLCEKAKTGVMNEQMAKTIRAILAAHTRQVIYQAFFVHKQNIYDSMPALLDPRVEYNGIPQTLTNEKYSEQHKLAFADLRDFNARSRAANANANANAASASGSGSATGTPTGTNTVSTPTQAVAASSPAASSPGTTPQAVAQSSPRPPPVANAAGRPPRPPIPKPDDLLDTVLLQRLLNIKDTKARASTLSATPGLQDRFARTLAWYGQNPNEYRAKLAVTANQSSPAANSGPGTPSAKTTAGAPVAAALNPALQRTSSPAPANTLSPGQIQVQARPPPPPVRPAVRPPQPIRPATPPTQPNSQPQSNAAVGQNNARPPPPPPPPVSISGSNAAVADSGNSGPPPASTGTASTAGAPSIPAATGPSAAAPPPPTQPPPNALPGYNPGLNAAASGSGSGSGLAIAPPRPFNLNLPPQRLQTTQPPPRPVPIESEIDRRKRKVKEMVAEEAPGMDIEHGVQRILSEYLDAWMDEAAEGAIRLAKHRKSGKVDLKDMALSIDMKHDLRIPGFNVQLPNRTHLPSEADRRRGRAVVPRAARKAREAE